MTPGLALDSRVLPQPRTRGADGSAVTATAVGMAAALVAQYAYATALRSQVRPDQLYSSEIVKSSLYYAAHGIEIACLLTAGALALRRIPLNAMQSNYVPRIALCWLAAALMAVRGYSLQDALSTKLVHGAGPFPFFIGVLVFVGVERENWRVLNRLIAGSAAVLSVYALYSMMGMRTFTRQEGVISLGTVLNALFWPAAYLVLAQLPQGVLLRTVRLVPIAVFALGTVFTQTRLNVVMLIALLLVRMYLNHRRRVPQAVGLMSTIGVLVWLALLVGIFMRDTRAFHGVEAAAQGFYSRIDEDTRSGQLRHFADTVPAADLVLGRGSMATWTWGPVEWNGGTDVGYLTLLFYGGVPLFLTYVAAFLAPAYRILRERPSDLQLTAAGIVILWSIRMFSSSYPGLAFDYYPVLLCMGACICRAPLRRAL